MSMKKWVALYPICYRVLYVLLLAGILIMGFGDFLGVRNVSGWHWFFVVVLIALFAWIHYGRVKEKIIGAVLLLVSVLVLIPFIGAGKTEGFWDNYYHWLILRQGYAEEWLIGYELMQTVWIVAGCYLFQIAAQKCRTVKELSAAGLFVALLVCMFRKVEVHQVGVALIICYMVTCVVERIRMSWEKHKALENQGYLIWLVPFLAVYILLMSLIPAKEEPYDWALAKRIYSNLREKIVTWMEEVGRTGREDFDTFLTGFSEDSGMEGNLAEDNRELMTVTGTDSLITNLYLAGKVYDTFDGRKWEQTITTDTGEYPLDALELLYAIKRYDTRWQSNYVRNTRINLKYGSFDTGYLFVPMKLSYLYETDYEISGRDFLFGTQKGYGTTYDLSFYQLNLNMEAFKELLESEQPEDEKEWADTVNRYAPNAYKTLSFEELKAYRQRMKALYSREIVLSEQVQEYVQVITEGCETSYERLLALEEALAAFEYNQSPGGLPDGVDSPEKFLDYFLLDSKKGYCTYFATCFVLLAQAEGFPARYVEGFCVPIKDKEHGATVYSNMAHAWPEVYVEGMGWIPFEPTPGYAKLRYEGWILREEKEEEPKEAEYSSFSTPSPSPNLQESVSNDQKINVWRRVLVLLKVVAIVLPLLLVILLLERLRQKRRYLKMSMEDKFLVEVRRNLRLFARLGCKRQETETLSELQNQIQEALPELAEIQEEWQFLKGYEEYLYRKAEVPQVLLQESIKEREKVLIWLKESNKGYYYMIRIWLFLTM